MGEAFAVVGAVYKIIHLAYGLVALACLYLAWRFPKKRTAKAAWGLAVAILFAYFPAKWTLDARREEQEESRFRQAGWEHFLKRCKDDAGERIERTAENVAGLYIRKPRTRATSGQLRDQFWMGDPYGYSSYEADNPAGIFLWDRTGITISETRFTPIKGFEYVEMSNPDFVEGGATPRYLRFTLAWIDVRNSVSGEMEKRLEPVGKAVNALRSKYAIAWEDISTQEDRKHWVAGGTMTVYELKTGDVLARRVGYMIEPQFGNTVQGRLPWQAPYRIPQAYCPQFEEAGDRNKEFAAKVLEPRGSREFVAKARSAPGYSR